MKKIIYFMCVALIVQGCKDTTDDGPVVNTDNGQDLIEGVRLVFPYEDSLCNEGTDPTPTSSNVFFEWEANNNAEIYTLSLENLTTGLITEFETVDFIYPITIQRPESYRWKVSYQFQNETLESASWNFYNAGPGVQTYAPFPAELISPNMAQNINATNSVNLVWSGSDVDDDISNYDVYFGTSSSPDLVANGITNAIYTTNVTSGTVYYWRIVTNDFEGNSSQSDIFQFRVL